ISTLLHPPSAEPIDSANGGETPICYQSCRRRFLPSEPSTMRHWILLPIALVFIATVHAESPDAVSKYKWTVEDVVYAESAHGFQIGPKGRWAVWVKTVGDKDKGERVSNL